jgi:hypothetical protein
VLAWTAICHNVEGGYLTKRFNMEPETISLVSGSAPSTPEVKTKPFAMMAGVYTPGRKTGASSAHTPTRFEKDIVCADGELLGVR